MGDEPHVLSELDPRGIFRDPVGPLWHRAYCVSNARVVRTDVAEALALLGAQQMIVGPRERTPCLAGGKRPLVRLGGRLIGADIVDGAPRRSGFGPRYRGTLGPNVGPSVMAQRTRRGAGGAGAI